jgi:hypothetical protein
MHAQETKVVGRAFCAILCDAMVKSHASKARNTASLTTPGNTVQCKEKAGGGWEEASE